MTELDMLSKCPGWDKKSADEILDSSAWSMMVRWGDEEMRLRLSSTSPRDVIGLKISFDGEEHFLGLGNRETFPDLNVLWNEKKNLPDPLLLALIEKECGNLLQLLENAVRRQLTVVGLDDPNERAGTQGFEVVNSDGDIVAFFSLTQSHMVKVAFGDVSNIDTSHPDIRAMELPTEIMYASFMLNEDEASGISSGDLLLLPEASNPSSAKWLTDGVPEDDRYYVLADEQGVLTFGEIADNSLRDVPPPNRLRLFHKGKTIAVGSFTALAEHPAFAIEEVL